MDLELVLEKRDRENGQKAEKKEEGKVGKVAEEKCTGGENYGLLLQTLTIWRHKQLPYISLKSLLLFISLKNIHIRTGLVLWGLLGWLNLPQILALNRLAKKGKLRIMIDYMKCQEYEKDWKECLAVKMIQGRPNLKSTGHNTVFLKTLYLSIMIFYRGRAYWDHAWNIFSLNYLLYFTMVCFIGSFLWEIAIQEKNGQKTFIVNSQKKKFKCPVNNWKGQ